MKNVVIAVIDSGYSGEFKERIEGGFCLNTKEHEFQDSVGHGTAIVDLIASETKSAMFFVVKTSGNKGIGKSGDLVNALNYIYDNVKCDIVHISAGVRTCYEMAELIDVIDRLHKRGTLIVSSFDNAGALSYPASLKEVLGVDVTNEFRKKGQYEYVEGDIVNIRYANVHYRVNWNGQKALESGTSYAGAMITAKSAEILASCDSKIDLSAIREELKKNAVKVVKEERYPVLTSSEEIAKKIRKAVAFPFNKEMYAIASNEDQLIFDKIEYYDTAVSMNVSKNVSEVLPYTMNKKIIKNIEELDWNSDFDTMILGHLSIYEGMEKGITKKILEKCTTYGKKVFSFGNITEFYDIKSEAAKDIAFPYVDLAAFPQNRFGKLRFCSRPVLLVCGTSSRQGKYSLQMILKRKLIERDYKVFHISTEPYGALLGAEKTFPSGFDSTVYTDSVRNVAIVNEMLFEAEKASADIVLSGTQSQTAPTAYFNQKYIPIRQYEMLYGLNPDAVVLVVNGFDDIKYIQKTKQLLESATRASVLALATFSTYVEVSRSGIVSKRKNFDSVQAEKQKVYMKENIGLDLFYIGENKDMNDLTEKVIGYFSGGECRNVDISVK